MRFSLFAQGEVDTVELFVNYYNFAQDSTYDKVSVKTWTASDFPANGFIPSFDLTSQMIAVIVGMPAMIVRVRVRMV